MTVTEDQLEKGSSFPSHDELQKDDDLHVLTESEKMLEKTTLRRLDLLLVPMVCLIYLLAFLDRSNIGNAVRVP